jgi:hypothetical protein
MRGVVVDQNQAGAEAMISESVEGTMSGWKMDNLSRDLE